MPNEAAILLGGESSGASTSGSTSGITGASVIEGAKSIDQPMGDTIEDGYGSDTSLSSLDSDDYESATRVETKSPSKKSADDMPPLKKAHMDVLNKLVSQIRPYRTISCKKML